MAKGKGGRKRTGFAQGVIGFAGVREKKEDGTCKGAEHGTYAAAKREGEKAWDLRVRLPGLRERSARPFSSEC